MTRHLAKYFRRAAGEVFRFARARRGATAVEFALIAPAFLAVLIAILETAIFLFAQQTLQTAALQAGRALMTGSGSALTQSQFANNTVCPLVQALFNCSNLYINVQSYTDFAAASTSAPTLTYDANGSVSNTWNYTAGAPGQVMVVQLIYQWSVVGGPLGFLLSNLPNGSAEMMGISAFRVEPY
ncbi:MAG: pilus assembly protein [Xanthobacteraceae bacterium]|nr:pilus assembly protein [Xanthobacteraceae bacterium]